MANLRPELDTAIFSVLNVASLVDLATGGVYSVVAPAGTEPPYVIFQPQSKIDDYWAFTKRGGEALYMVKAVSRSPWPMEASTIDTEVDTLLQDATLSISGYTHLHCRRESDIDVPVTEGDVVYQQIGGLYRIIADE